MVFSPSFLSLPSISSLPIPVSPLPFISLSSHSSLILSANYGKLVLTANGVYIVHGRPCVGLHGGMTVSVFYILALILAAGFYDVAVSYVHDNEWSRLRVEGT